MTIQEAIKSGKKFRRPGGWWVVNDDNPVFLTLQDALATDWEIEKEPEVYEFECKFTWDNRSLGVETRTPSGFPLAAVGKRVWCRAEVIE